VSRGDEEGEGKKEKEDHMLSSPPPLKKKENVCIPNVESRKKRDSRLMDRNHTLGRQVQIRLSSCVHLWNPHVT
jgi:hypothetical protein